MATEPTTARSSVTTSKSFGELWDTLSRREQEVAQCKCQNLSSKEIGDVLFISPSTVKNTLTNVYRKLEMDRNRSRISPNGGAAQGFMCWQLGVITGIRIGRATRVPDNDPAPSGG